jgi:hypothetical protein
MLEILPAIQSEDTRMELAFALALIGGKEHAVIQLHRRTKIDLGTAISQSMLSIRKKSRGFQAQGIELLKHLDESAEAFAHQDLDYGFKNLLTFLRLIPLDQLGTDCKLILQAYMPGLDEFGLNRMEYILLMLHVLNLDDFPCWDGG